MERKKSPLMGEIEGILKKDPSRMWSREEILNILAPNEREKEIEQLLAELEVSGSTGEKHRPDIYATCRGGTVYYKWNKG